MTALLRSYARAKAPFAEASKVAGEALDFPVAITDRVGSPAAVDFGAEGGSIERDQLRGEIGDLADERGDDLLLRALADIRGAESQDRPAVILSLGDQGTDGRRSNDR